MLRSTQLPQWSLGFAVLSLIGCTFETITQARDQAGRLEVGAVAADFELKALDGEKVKLSKLVEDGPVVLIILRGNPGYQCPVCNAQVGQFLAGAKEFKGRASVVFVYPGPTAGLKNRAAEFARGKTLPENFYLLLDPDYELTEAYHLRWNAPKETVYPSAFVIDGQRKIQFAKISMTHGGRATSAEVLKVLESE